MFPERLCKENGRKAQGWVSGQDQHGKEEKEEAYGVCLSHPEWIKLLLFFALRLCLLPFLVHSTPCLCQRMPYPRYSAVFSSVLSLVLDVEGVISQPPWLLHATVHISPWSSKPKLLPLLFVFVMMSYHSNRKGTNVVSLCSSSSMLRCSTKSCPGAEQLPVLCPTASKSPEPQAK